MGLLGAGHESWATPLAAVRDMGSDCPKESQLLRLFDRTLGLTDATGQHALIGVPVIGNFIEFFAHL
jgi:hypothetical protein